MKIVNRDAGMIDYRLNQLGIRVWNNAAQLIAKWHETEWATIGPPQKLPVKFPVAPPDLKDAAGDPLRLTAYQFDMECPGTDLRAVLALEKDFKAAVEFGTATDRTPA
jgi:hypothetical protein